MLLHRYLQQNIWSFRNAILWRKPQTWVLVKYESYAMMILVACDSYVSEGFKSTQSGLKCKEKGWIFLHSASFSLKSFVGYCGRDVTNVKPLLWSQSGKQDTLPSATELKRYLKKKNFWLIIDLNLMWLCFKTNISWIHHLSDWNTILEWWKYWHHTGQSHS